MMRLRDATLMIDTHILIVDDDHDIGQSLRDYLQHHGYTANMVHDDSSMQSYLAQHPVDLIVLDVMLGAAKPNGLDILRKLRLESTRPIVMWSDLGEEAIERVLGLEFGADDYLPKSMSYREVMARIGAVLRRNQRAHSNNSSPPHKTYCFGHYKLDLTAHLLCKAGQEIEITNAEFNLLQAFVTHANQTLTRDSLTNAIRGYEPGPYDRSIDVCVSRLRQKIESDPKKPVYIRTVWGTGYLFSPEGASYKPAEE